MSAQKSLLLVGCGKMGHALLSRWREQQPAGIERFFVIDPHAPANDVLTELADLAGDILPDIIVFAVKPQQLSELFPDYAARFGAKPLYISIAAGKTLAFYAQHLGDHARIVRVMPNTPALIGEGVSVLCASPALALKDKQMATALMEVTGAVEWIDDEAQMDAVTALSGCGPAYVFLFLESLVKAAVGLGLPEALAKSLALHMLAGSTQLAMQSELDLASLRQQVASPGGATEAALKVLMQDGALERLMAQAMQQAAKRSEELA